MLSTPAAGLFRLKTEYYATCDPFSFGLCNAAKEKGVYNVFREWDTGYTDGLKTRGASTCRALLIKLIKGVTESVFRAYVRQSGSVRFYFRVFFKKEYNISECVVS